MKKKFAFILLPMMILPLASCGGSSSIVQLTYGDLINSTTQLIHSADFDTMMKDKENFLMAIYPEDSMCSCWGDFEKLLDNVVKNDHVSIYKYSHYEVAGNPTMQKLGGFYAFNNQPSFYILADGKLIKSYEYNINNPFFKKYNDFMKEITSRCRLSKMMRISEEQLDEIRNNEGMIFYARHSCPDCSQAIPGVIVPYMLNHDLIKPIYYFDLDPYRVDMEDYQNRKDLYGLSNRYNTELGYGDGVVPTFQVIKNGEIESMCVYSNDSGLTYNEEERYYYNTTSYYMGDRLNKLTYLEGLPFSDLTKVKYSEEDTYINIYERRVLKENVVEEYHNAILNNFFDKYLA